MDCETVRTKDRRSSDRGLSLFLPGGEHADEGEGGERNLWYLQGGRRRGGLAETHACMDPEGSLR
jgi:hypothetical protein